MIHPPNPHRVPRSKGTEQRENSVPSVLDSGAPILAGLEDVEVGDQVAVVSPASPTFDQGRSGGFASPIGSFRSCSRSPLGVRIGLLPQSRAEVLLNLPAVSNAAVSSPCVLGLHNITSPSLSPTRPAITTQIPSQRTTVPPMLLHHYLASSHQLPVSDLSTKPSPTTTVEHLSSPVLSPSNPIASEYYFIPRISFYISLPPPFSTTRQKTSIFHVLL